MGPSQSTGCAPWLVPGMLNIFFKFPLSNVKGTPTRKMTTKLDLKKWIVEALKAHGGCAQRYGAE